MANVKLSVRNLTISFRTINGKVQAVRNIDFDLHEGETLAIVGESGSGKSVTSKAILGILAGNSIPEGGEIIYDGMDLMKISEEQFQKIRGDKIAMIFQDPLSSLNPIVRIGRQLTEAMLLKGKARQRESRRTFNTYLQLMQKVMVEGVAGEDATLAGQLVEMCRNFDKFEYKHLELERAYNRAIEAAKENVSILENLIFEIEKNAAKDLKYRLGRVAHLAKLSIHNYVVSEYASELTCLTGDLKTLASKKGEGENTDLLACLNRILEISREACGYPVPNFFSMGYFLTFSGEMLPEMPVEELNRFLREYLDEHFMLEFISYAKRALEYSAARSYEKKANAVALLNESKALFQGGVIDRKTAWDTYTLLSDAVNNAIDRLETVKDSRAYTFATSLKSQVEQYFSAQKKNAEEEVRYAKQQAKYDRAVSRGKTPDWKVVPKSLVDLEKLLEGIARNIQRMSDHFAHQLENRDSRDFDAEAVAFIDFLKASASGVVNRVTKAIAKERALKLMEEVGIPEPRKRYRQYPFEFSGGMRQRIVIAIALAADPDILICDEPTTALDVTIQAQILELINRLKRERSLSVIFITHDLGVVANMADKIAVMYAGKIVEQGTAEEVFYSPAHPYTWALLSSMPDLDTNEKLEAIPGTPPNMIYPPVGDAFAARNKYAMEIDFEQQPPMFPITETHSAATWLLHEYAPKVEMPKIVTERIARMKKLREESEDAK